MRHKGDGQDVEWTVHKELRSRFDEMLKKLQD